MTAGAFENRRFAEALVPCAPLSGLDVHATLQHFAIISYAVPCDRVRPHVDARFELDSFRDAKGQPRVWVSMVPFEDEAFRFACARWPRFSFGQTNYRTYVKDPATDKHAVWFFGTTLSSPTVAVPRYLWKLPWHHGRITFECSFNEHERRYTRYRMTTRSDWAPAEIELEDSGEPVSELEGIADFEGGLVALTHPMMGVYYRRDGALGTYSIWHDRLAANSGRIIKAKIDLFDRLKLVPFAEQQLPHSVLIQRRTEFAIFLPPRRLGPK